jgi:IS4 transposase
LDIVPLEAGAFYIMDRGYLDFGRLYAITQASAFYVIRAKSNLRCRRVYSHPVDRDTGLICDQSVLLTGYYQSKGYPDKLRRVKYYDADSDKTLVFLTNNFSLPALTIAELYRCRWQVEMFFRWIKQNLRIKSFYGTSENAVKAQRWIAVSVYVLVAIMKKRLKIEASLYTILQVLSVTIFERMPLLQALTDSDYRSDSGENNNQLFLFS